MTETTLKLVKRLLQERMQKRLRELPELGLEELVDAFIDASSLECIDFRLKAEGAKGVLLDALDKDLSVLDRFLGQVAEELVALIGEEKQEEEQVEEDQADEPVEE